MYSRSDLRNGIVSGLVDDNSDAPSDFEPKLVLNDGLREKKVLEFILDNLQVCDSIKFAVAFITRSGVACLHQALQDFLQRGGKGEILISAYLLFSEPHAIRTLSRFPGLSVGMISAGNFHGKTYIFEFAEYAQVLIGSSNLTQNALGVNTEVNLNVPMSRTSKLYLEAIAEFDSWSKSSARVTDKSLSRYEELWQEARKSQHVDKPIGTFESQNSPRPEREFTVNSMQKAALLNLQSVRDSGHSRSLVISATGTGKTVLSAFDVEQFGAKRLLFVVHRLNIAKKALSEFRRVFGNTRSMGIYSAGESLRTEDDFVFCTVQTINSERHLHKFAPDEFDYIIIDETHRAGAATYQRVIDYFSPKFLLGMTATPERGDGFDIFSLFDHSVAYEIRLQDALDADLLSPFHYFGVADISVDGIPLDEKSDFGRLTHTDRVEHIIASAAEYGCDSESVRGLVFCSRLVEAQQLSKEFNIRGYKTVSITGGDPEGTRELAIQRLESEDDDKLDYIFTVDVFNEGVDIPKVNQVIMLRPTASAIIFVQQLGRGLRKAIGKDYLTVIDFIGNYQNNYLIPLALFGDSSYNKDRLRRLLSTGSGLIPGASTISFQKVAKESIFSSIDSSNLSTKKALVEDYEQLSYRLGRSPKMMDFIEQNSRDPYQYVAYSGSLLAFNAMLDKQEAGSDEYLKLLSYLGKHVCDGTRLEEGVILEALLENGEIDLGWVMHLVSKIANYSPSKVQITSAIHNLNLNFITERSDKKTLRVSELSGFQLVKCSDDEVMTADRTLLNVRSEEKVFNCLLDLARASNAVFLKEYDSTNFIEGFKRGTKYSRKSVFRILGWDKLPNAQNVGGYIVSSDGSNCPIFLTYHKEEGISETTKYEDHFLNPRHLVYMSKSRRTLASPDVQAIKNKNQSRIRLPLFVKKNDDEGLEFYYLGELTPIPSNFQDAKMAEESTDSVSVVKMEFLLDEEVEHHLFRYLTET